jgi:hypothetical protein
VRYVLYANDLENQGLIYTSSKYHWEGDGKNTSFFLPDREYNTSQTSWRPTGTTTIEDHLLKAYAQVYPNLRVHDPNYPTPEHLLSITKIGNVAFDSEMAKDTPGSDLIKTLILAALARNASAHLGQSRHPRQRFPRQHLHRVHRPQLAGSPRRGPE